MRQKFTKYERDTETGLDFAEARYFSSTQGRFTSTDPLLGSGSIYDPQTWNRYSYTINNPLNFVDPTGMFTFDLMRSTATQQKKFIQALANIRAAKNFLQVRGFGKEAENLGKILTAYGSPGTANGVVVGFDSLPKNTPGLTSPGVNVDSKYEVTGPDIRVTIDDSQLGSNSDNWAETVAHEGSHVSDFVDSAQGLPKDLSTEENVQKAFDSMPLHYDTEARAFEVSSSVVQGREMKGTYLVSDNYEIWNSAWKTIDDVRSKRSAGVSKLLTDPKGPYAGKIYDGKALKRVRPRIEWPK